MLLLGAVGFVGNGAGNGLLLSAPAVLIANAGLSTTQAGVTVSAGGALGVLFIIVAGWRSDHRGDRLGGMLVVSSWADVRPGVKLALRAARDHYARVMLEFGCGSNAKSRARQRGNFRATAPSSSVPGMWDEQPAKNRVFCRRKRS